MFSFRTLLAHAALTVGGALSAFAQAPTPASTDSITLRDVLTTVRAEHPLTRAAAARVDVARASRTTAGAFSNPVLQYQVENTPLPGRSSIPLDREAMATAMIPLEGLYQRGARVARADADLRASQADARSRGIALSLDAARAYYRVALAQVGTDVTRDIAAWLDSVVTYNRARVKEGIAAEADLIRAQLEQDRARAEVAMQEADLARERAMLASYLPTGRSSMRVVVGERPRSWRLTSTDTLAGPPMVTAARERVRGAKSGVAIEQRMIIRDLSATIGTKQTGGFTSLIAGFSLPLPVLNVNRGEIARASAERRVAEFELIDAERTATETAAGAFEAARVLAARTEQLAAPVPGSQDMTPALLLRADESRRIAQAAYREGAMPLVTVLDAARAWGDVRLAFYKMLFAQHESALALAAAFGVDPAQVVAP